MKYKKKNLLFNHCAPTMGEKPPRWDFRVGEDLHQGASLGDFSGVILTYVFFAWELSLDPGSPE